MAIYPWNSLNPDNSPFVEVFSEIGITIAASLINLVVLSAAASACNSAIYSTGRMLRSLAQEGSALKNSKVNNTSCARECFDIFYYRHFHFCYLELRDA